MVQGLDFNVGPRLRGVPVGKPMNCKQHKQKQSTPKERNTCLAQIGLFLLETIMYPLISFTQEDTVQGSLFRIKASTIP